MRAKCLHDGSCRGCDGVQKPHVNLQYSILSLSSELLDLLRLVIKTKCRTQKFISAIQIQRWNIIQPDLNLETGPNNLNKTIIPIMKNGTIATEVVRPDVIPYYPPSSWRVKIEI